MSQEPIKTGQATESKLQRRSLKWAGCVPDLRHLRRRLSRSPAWTAWTPARRCAWPPWGLIDELINSRFPWICTLCGRCERACPMGVEILAMLRTARGLRERDKVPGPIHKGTMMSMNRGNNLGIPNDDWAVPAGRHVQGDGGGGLSRASTCPVDKRAPGSSPRSTPRSRSASRTT